MKTLDSFVKAGYFSRRGFTYSLTQRVFLNALSSFIDNGVRVLVSLVITPLLVAGLGSGFFGIWLILNRSISYLLAVDARPTQALKWVIANYQKHDDHSIKRRAVSSALGVWLALLPFMIAVGGVLVFVSPTLTKVSPEFTTLVRVTCWLLVVNLILSVLANIPGSVLRGMNLAYKRMGLVASLNILGGFLTAAAVYLNWGLVGVATAQVVVTVVTGILFWHLVRTYVPWFGVERVSLKEVRQFFGLSKWYAAWSLIDTVLTASDVIVLGLIISASAVTNYVLTGYVSQGLLTIVTIIMGAAAPGLGGLFGEKKYDRVIELRNEMLCITCLLAGAFGSMILLYNHSFTTLWVGGEHYVGPWVNLLLVLIAVQLLFLRVEIYLIDLTLNVRRKVTFGLLSALLSIGLAILLTRNLGITGLCIAILAGRSVLMIIYPSIIGAFLGTQISIQIKALIRPLLTMIILFAAAAYVGEQVLATTWINLFIQVLVAIPLVFLFQFVVGFSANQKKCLIDRLRHLTALISGSPVN